MELLEQIKIPLYNAMVLVLYMCYFLLYLGVFYINPEYIETLSRLIRLFICSVLIIKFHPFREHKLKEFDGQIIFAGAVLILTDMGVTKYVLATIASKSNIKNIQIKI
jgi:hypothetical protein